MERGTLYVVEKGRAEVAIHDRSMAAGGEFFGLRPRLLGAAGGFGGRMNVEVMFGSRAAVDCQGHVFCGTCGMEFTGKK
jgi:hypothetical protein